MKSYLIKTFGIVMVAVLAGVAHFATGEKIEFAQHLGETQNIIDEPQQTGNDDNSNDDTETQEPPAVIDPVTDPVVEEPAGDGLIELTAEEKILDREITTRQAGYLFQNDLAEFFDARPKATYEDGHIQDAFSLPVGSFENGEPFSVSILDESKYIVIYCSGGNCEESHFIAEDIATERPELEGMIHIYVDGYGAWVDFGLPTMAGPDPFAE